MVGQKGDIAGAVPECGQMHLYRIDPVEQILAENAIGHILVNAGIGGTDHSYIDGNGLGGAHTHDFTSFKYGKQF